MIFTIVMVSHCYFTDAGAIGATGRFTESTLPLHIIDLNCTGTEQRVIDCPQNSLLGQHACDHRQDASVRCQGTILMLIF